MNTETLRRRILRENSLPILPQVVVKVQQVAQREEASSRDLAEIILKDQVLTSRLLRIANSTFYAHKVFTVNHAIVVLGFETVRNITLSLVSHSILKKFTETRGFKEFWHHSIGTAIAAQVLAQHKEMPVPEEAFVAGLVHDFGKLILFHFSRNEYERVLDLVAQGHSYLKAERDVLGIDHQVAGRLLAEKWQFPHRLLQTISDHHRQLLREDEKTDLLNDIVSIADMISFHLFGPTTQAAICPVEEIVRKAETLLGLPYPLIGETIAFTQSHHEEVLKTLELSPRERDTSVTEKRIADPSADEMVRKVQQYDCLASITKKLVGQAPPAEILKEIMTAIHQTLSLSKCILFLIRQPGEILEGVAAMGQGTEEFIQGTQIILDQRHGLVKKLMQTQKVQNAFAMEGERRSAACADKLTDILGTVDIVAIPLFIQGKVCGLVTMDRLGRDPNYISEGDVQSVQVFVDQLTLLFERYAPSMPSILSS